MIKTKFLLLSDLHIRNFTRHDEYAEYFHEISEKIEEIAPDFIIFGGDLAHSKTNLSPDYFRMAYTFLEKLQAAYDQPVFFLPGNHDCSEKNLARLDAISPLFYHLSDDYTLLRSSQDVRLDGRFNRFVLRAYSILDKENWKYDRTGLKSDDILIGLFHGPLKGARTDLGYVFEHAEDIEKFKCCDFLWCGDIHSHFFYDKEKRICSIGNPIQQDYGESLKKGMLLYSITSPTDFDVEFVEIPNLYPYITIDTDDPLTRDFTNARVRIVSDKPRSELIEFEKKFNTIAKNAKNPLHVIIKPSIISKNKDKSEIISFSDYVKDHTDKEKILTLHDTYVQKLNQETKSTNWTLKTLKWSNLFSYGPSNEFDFQKSAGKSVGIFGSNYSGKTSFIDVICFSLFGTWTKDFIKQINFIHSLQNVATSEVYLEVNKKEYRITRKLERVTRGKKIDCKSTIDVRCITDDTSLNGDDIRETQRNICNLIGNIEDFLVTSFSTQFNNFSVLAEKNTKRKEFLSRFLGVDIYEKIADLVKNDIDVLKIDMEKYQNTETQNSLEDMRNQITERISDSKLCQDKLLPLKSELEKLKYDHVKYEKIVSDFDQIQKEFVFYANERSRSEERIKVLRTELTRNGNEVMDCTLELSQSEKDITAAIVELTTKLTANKSEIAILNRQINDIKEREKILSSVPCNNAFPTCRFLINAQIGTDSLEKLQKNVDKLRDANVKLDSAIKTENESLANCAQMLKAAKADMARAKLLAAKQAEFDLIQNQTLPKCNKQIADCELKLANQQVDRTYFAALSLAINDLKIQTSELLSTLSANDKIISTFTKMVDSLEKKLTVLYEKQKELDFLTEYYSLVGKNGIVLSILTMIMPTLSELMTSLVQNIADFKVSIEIEDEKNVEIYIEDTVSKRLIESASGAQRSIAALALRQALLNYSQLCSSNLFVLDEPATSLDKDHLPDFSKILDVIKATGKIILLVTHIESLKDCVDVQCLVQKIDGYSKLAS